MHISVESWYHLVPHFIILPTNHPISYSFYWQIILPTNHPTDKSSYQLTNRPIVPFRLKPASNSTMYFQLQIPGSTNTNNSFFWANHNPRLKGNLVPTRLWFRLLSHHRQERVNLSAHPRWMTAERDGCSNTEDDTLIYVDGCSVWGRWSNRWWLSQDL